MNSNQLGKISISRKLIVDYPEKVASIFAMLKLVSVRAEVMFYDYIEYIAISERFEEVPVGCDIPEYRLEIQSDGNGWPSAIIVQKENL